MQKYANKSNDNFVTLTNQVTLKRIYYLYLCH